MARSRAAEPANAPEKSLTRTTTARISASLRMSLKPGIALAERPLLTVKMRSESVGGEPAAVDLYLKSARVKSRGLGIRVAAAGPLPRPSGPWHTAQRSAKTFVPSGVFSGNSDPGGQTISAYSFGSGCQASVGCE